MQLDLYEANIVSPLPTPVRRSARSWEEICSSKVEKRKHTEVSPTLKEENRKSEEETNSKVFSDKVIKAEAEIIRFLGPDNNFAGQRAFQNEV